MARADKMTDAGGGGSINLSAVRSAVNALKNASKTKVNPTEVVKGLSDAERRAVGAELKKINPAPKTGKFPSEAEKPKDATQIIRNPSGTKVVKIDPEGNMSSRPTTSVKNIKVKYEVGDGKTSEKGVMQVPKPLPKGTQANHAVTDSANHTKPVK
jgi:hypothetical protein